jgi:hypothetical protein
MKTLLAAFLMAGLAAAGHAESLSGLCMISASHDKDTAQVVFRSSDCSEDGQNCSMSHDSGMAWSRWTGVSSEALTHEGAQLTGRMSGEAGEIQCSGTVHESVLAGRYEFTPNPGFVQKMASMGFEEITLRKQLGFLMLDITTAWVQQMKADGVTELTTGRLMGLRALHVDHDYVRGMAAAGYSELRAGKLTEMKAVGVTPEKAQDAKALGFQPTEQELIQMSIFKIDRPFVERMRARGLTDLTLAKLIKVKIFKLDE